MMFVIVERFWQDRQLIWQFFESFKLEQLVIKQRSMYGMSTSVKSMVINLEEICMNMMNLYAMFAWDK